jgi:hypothetical protein
VDGKLENASLPAATYLLICETTPAYDAAAKDEILACSSTQFGVRPKRASVIFLLAIHCPGCFPHEFPRLWVEGSES